MLNMKLIFATGGLIVATGVLAHDTTAPHAAEAGSAARPMPIVVEQRGPVKAPAPSPVRRPSAVRAIGNSSP